MGPDVARVRGDEKGQVTDQAHTSGARMGLQACSLTEQHELNKPNPVHLARQSLSRPVQRGWRAADQLFRPLEIAGAVVSRRQGSEQRIVVQPVGMVIAKVFEVRAQVRSRAGAEVLPCRLEQGELEALDGVEVDGRGRKGAARAVGRPHQSVLDQPVGADQERVAGKRRQRLVRRIAVAGGTQRERLPPALPRLVKPVHPRHGRRTDIADSVR